MIAAIAASILAAALLIALHTAFGPAALLLGMAALALIGCAALALADLDAEGE
ncbi:hypothetical protein GCM10010964_43340 [Caldovatus sediminis]|uniref:Uncharacterized protein n=1 Tax=Caldovatus sediminis TaxID=2041189 RepID=A0A8J2ZF57_9PROT|nr:hypothetical protein [Caldovatus sediminis]GGG51427.1 hypothetical protein GCM10010964_43340 [Caldovatus sediminis]